MPTIRDGFAQAGLILVLGLFIEKISKEEILSLGFRMGFGSEFLKLVDGSNNLNCWFTANH